MHACLLPAELQSVSVMAENREQASTAKLEFIRSILKPLCSPFIIVFTPYTAGISQTKPTSIRFPLVSSLAMLGRYSRKLLVQSFVRIKRPLTSELSAAE